MGDKRVLNAFCGAADITLCGLPHAEGAKYVPPTAEVTVFALEKGFAGSGSTTLQGTSAEPQSTPAGQFGTEDWSGNTWN